jgi:hypothetical protein
MTTHITGFSVYPTSDMSEEVFDPAADDFIAELAQFVFDANTVADEVNTKTDSCTTSAATATTAAATASTAASTAVNAPGAGGTSTTSLTIGTGSRSFTTQTGKNWAPGQPVIIARTSAPTTTWMAGIISAYTTGTGAMSVTVATGWTAGSGTFTDWTISLTAPTPSALPITGSFLTQATARLLGRTTAGTGTPEEISVDSSLTLTAGILSVTVPQGLVLLASATASSSATIDFTSGIDSTYDEYELHLHNVVPASASASPFIRLSHDGTTWPSTNSYSYAFRGYTSSGTDVSLSNASAAAIQISNNPDSSAGASGISGVFRLFRPATAGIKKHATFHMVADPQTGGAIEVDIGAGEIKDATTVVVGIRFLLSSGNIASGNFKLYGVRKT